VVLIVATVLLQFIVPFLGHPTITKLLNYLAVVFIVVFAVMAVLVVPHVDLHRLAETRQAGHMPVAAPWQVVTTAIVLLIAAGGLGWTENGNDYSRYLPRRTPATSTFWAATLGPAIPSILLELLGAAAFSVSPASTEVTGVPSAFAAWFFWPFLVLTLPQLFAINSLDLYSSGVTLQALGAPVNRLGAVVIDTILAGAVTALVIFRGSFLNDLSGFLGYIVVWLAPWFGVLITDWLLRRGRYDPQSLAAEGGGVYWRHGGVHWNAIVALVTGGVAAALWINGSSYQPAYVSPISSATGGTDFSWLIGIVVAAAVYWALCRRSVPAEAAVGG
jgi:purine-cytosine permease-like protein